MIGDKRKYNVCLVTLKCVENANGTFSNKLAAAAQSAVPKSSATTVEEARECDAWRAYIQSAIDKANADAVSRASKIQKFTILDGDFSVHDGNLTATLKLKRPVVNEQFKDEIEALYA